MLRRHLLKLFQLRYGVSIDLRVLRFVLTQTFSPLDISLGVSESACFFVRLAAMDVDLRVVMDMLRRHGVCMCRQFFVSGAAAAQEEITALYVSNRGLVGLNHSQPL